MRDTVIKLDVIVSGNVELPMDVYVAHSIYPDYDGPLEFTPKVHEDQNIPTRNKSLKDDIIFKKIPYLEVPNTFGTTAIIG